MEQRAKAAYQFPSSISSPSALASALTIRQLTFRVVHFTPRRRAHRKHVATGRRIPKR
jgi:hypothetical protein